MKGVSGLEVTATTTDIEKWVQTAAPGDAVIFYLGTDLPRRIGNVASRLREAGLVTTCQRRCPFERVLFEHIAIRRPPQDGGKRK